MAGPSPELASPLADLPVSPTHYERTGLAPTASTDEIRAAYRAWVAAGASAAETSAAETRPAQESPAAETEQAAALPADDGAADADDAAELRLAYAVLNDPLRRRVYDAYLLSHQRVMTRAGRWWRRPGFRRALRPALTVAFMLAAIAFAGLQVWRAYTY